MTPEFTPISERFIKEYKELLCAGQGRASDYSFGNIWGWREPYGLEWRLREGLCWIRQTRPLARGWAPVGDWQGRDWAGSAVLREGGAFIRVPEELALRWQEALPGRVALRESRGHWDYLYSARELASLAGNRFHKKKNLVNQFSRLYASRYLPVGAHNLEALLALQEQWLKQQKEPLEALLAEDVAVRRVLGLWDAVPGLAGGILEAQGELVAYTVGESISPGLMVIHFEKGLPGYKGVYQAINNAFAKAMAARGIESINREQDLDDPGLRQAKQSYNPVEYIKKFEVDLAAAAP